MDFKFKEQGRKPGEKEVETEAPESEAAGDDRSYSQLLGPASAGDDAPQEVTTPTNRIEESESVQTAPSTSQPEQSEAVATPQAEPIPERFEIYDDPPPLLSFKRLFFLALLIGGGYFGYSYYATGRIPFYLETPVVESQPQNARIETTDIEELTELLLESKELLTKRESEKNSGKASKVPVSAPAEKSNLSKMEILNTYKGRWATITMKDGSERTGRVMRVDKDMMHLEQQLRSGSLSVRVPIQNIANIRP